MTSTGCVIRWVMDPWISRTLTDHLIHDRTNNSTPRCFNALMGTLKPHSNGPLYSNTMTGTLAVDGWAVTFGVARRGLGGPVYQLHIIRCGTIIKGLTATSVWYGKRWNFITTMVDSTNVLCPLFDKVEILVPDDILIARAFTRLWTKYEIL